MKVTGTFMGEGFLEMNLLQDAVRSYLGIKIMAMEVMVRKVFKHRF
jgi:hypothetical protein